MRVCVRKLKKKSEEKKSQKNIIAVARVALCAYFLLFATSLPQSMYAGGFARKSLQTNEYEYEYEYEYE